MRLLNVDTYELEEFIGENIPSYAILSHTWGSEEVLYGDITTTGPIKLQQKHGFTKIRYCAGQARLDILKYCWVDTCCIDKSSSAELTEAINSIYQWYKQADVCYVYLEIVREMIGRWAIRVDGSPEDGRCRS